jgi:hypothetical protein
MESKTFEGIDDADLERKIWDWQTANRVRITKRHPVERLPLAMKTVVPGYPKIVTESAAVSIRLDYENVGQ